MNDARDQAYLVRRMLQEEQAAREARCAEARVRHEQLAAAYRARCVEPRVYERVRGRQRLELNHVA